MRPHVVVMARAQVKTMILEVFILLGFDNFWLILCPILIDISIGFRVGEDRVGKVVGAQWGDNLILFSWTIRILFLLMANLTL